jgi:hypothetical protein
MSELHTDGLHRVPGAVIMVTNILLIVVGHALTAHSNICMKNIFRYAVTGRAESSESSGSALRLASRPPRRRAAAGRRRQAPPPGSFHAGPPASGHCWLRVGGVGQRVTG